MSLVARAAKRDNAAWQALVDLYGPLVASWCRRFGLDGHATADCVQDVFLAVVANLEKFQFPPHSGTSGAFRGWLWTIARNKLRDYFRRRARQVVQAPGNADLGRISSRVAEEALSDVDPTDDLQLAGLIRRALTQVEGAFEAKSWRAFWRSAVDGLPTALVADELGMSVAAVRQARSRVLRRMRQQLGDCR
jgi:RNA polymerase sigma-70 factor (ECF subfamily)